jgi:hypothetical protein
MLFITVLPWFHPYDNSEVDLKIRILVPDQGGREFQAGGIHLYFEDLKRAPNADMGPKDFFETTSILS